MMSPVTSTDGIFSCSSNANSSAMHVLAAEIPSPRLWLLHCSTAFVTMADWCCWNTAWTADVISKSAADPCNKANARFLSDADPILQAYGVYRWRTLFCKLTEFIGGALSVCPSARTA